MHIARYDFHGARFRNKLELAAASLALVERILDKFSGELLALIESQIQQALSSFRETLLSASD